MASISAHRSVSLRVRAAGWLVRYLPAELVCTSAALACALLASAAEMDAKATALACTGGEITAFYVVMLARELHRRGGRSLARVVRDLSLEFGPAEALDGAILRPALVYGGIALSDSPLAGAFIGKVAADVVFYALAAAGHELVQRRAAVGGAG